ncbi:MAG: DNA topoisomerase 3 [bacterium]|nr:DNA topoisomerase 3 [bacterium]
MKTLVIAEKPSVAQSIARVLKVNQHKNGYMENERYIISWCIGHLISPAAPEAYDDKYRKWSIENLPIIPKEWKYQVVSSTEKQYKVLQKLMKSKNVSMIVCATDAGREGELIFRLVYNQAECKKPFKRLWISSLEEQSIRDGFNNLRDGREFENLYHAASARSKADWLIGMNATRLYSVKNEVTLNIGRVQTPVLNMLVTREAEILKFVPEDYYTVEIDCGTFTAAGEKTEDTGIAQTIRNACVNSGKAVVKEVKTEHKTEAPPKLYDLTALQRDANRIIGFTANQTLIYAQSLYEKKLITYPRTDSRYITEDVEKSIPGLVKIAEKMLGVQIDQNIKPSRLTNNSKVSDHHALLPTKTLAKTDISVLSNGESEVLSLICRRLICAVAEPHKYDAVKLMIECGGFEFTANGKTVTDKGWRKFMSGTEENKNTELPELHSGACLKIESAEVKSHKTKPPKHFTDDTLLSAMENAVKSETAERAGLGTPATRAGIIENLVKRGFVLRKGKHLIPEDKGKRLIRLVPDSIKSADMTAEWEERLSEIAEGKDTEENFIKDIGAFLRSMIIRESE